ncbi:MAG: tryptophan-rich sensory protein [Eudoraea sp.]|nr:tryptophan-rich sensory protein [Eudoraea sp.]
MENILNALSWIDTIAPTVWIGLTVIMFWLLYKVYGKEGRKHPVFRFGVFLLVLVWLYPIYTFLFNQIEVGLAGNLFTLWATNAYRNRLNSIDKKMSKWMYPQIIWLCLATFYVTILLLVKYQVGQ